MKLRPIGDKVVVKTLESEEMSVGGIILPDSAKKKPQEGTVVSVGPGKLLDNGTRATMSVKEGMTVIYSKYGGTEVTVEGVEYTILDEDQIYAIKE
ncbi:MAG: co-chaperone GroES [bacterium]|jgi:chaperonin GroES